GGGGGGGGGGSGNTFTSIDDRVLTILGTEDADTFTYSENTGNFTITRLTDGDAESDVVAAADFDSVILQALGGDDVIEFEGFYTNFGGGTASLRYEGGDGNDVINIDSSNLDQVFGGEGDDVITLAGSGNALANGGPGNDDITGLAASGGATDGVDDILGGDGNDTLSGGATARGGDCDDLNRLSDYAFGGAGNDTIVAGFFGNVDAGEGDDTVELSIHRRGRLLDGGPGDDRFDVVDNA
ncbi:MAG: hypothetical protein AAGK78_17510, partial [Planctomycetota bacterium]